MHVPFTFTCGMEEGESPIGAAYLMQLNSLVPGPVPHRDGVEYTPEEVCQRFCGGRYCSWYFDSLDLASDAMIADWKYLSSPQVVSVPDHDDAVIHLRLGDGLYSTVGGNEGKCIPPIRYYLLLWLDSSCLLTIYVLLYNSRRQRHLPTRHVCRAVETSKVFEGSPFFNRHRHSTLQGLQAPWC